MKRHFVLAPLGLALFWLSTLLPGSALRAADWQWSVKVDAVRSAETNASPRAFLWIPPGCQQVRGVVVGQHNMLEEPILENPRFRQVLGELGLAEIWVSPGLNMVFDFNQGAGEQFESMMKALAEESGYRELVHAPIAPIGHSACASYPWNFAAWKPERTLAVLSIKGDTPLTPLTGSGRPNPDWGTRSIEGIPGLLVMGEYEWMEKRLAAGPNYVAQHPRTALAVLCDAGRGHFDASDRLVDFIALFLRKAVAARLPAPGALDEPVPLKPVYPQDGWLMDRWHKDLPPNFSPAPYAEYKGNRSESFWCFDKEQADATEAIHASARGKQPQLLGYVQEGSLVPQTGGHAQVKVRFLPLDDGESFQVTGGFLDTVPPGNPSVWSGLPAGAAISHAGDREPVVISRICGPVRQTAPDRFTISFYRMGMDNPRRSGDIWLLASHPGDARTKSAVQQANLRIPTMLSEGAPQTISFPAIPNQARHTKSVPLRATSSSGAPVHYYVVAGPAEVEGDALRITAIPPRAKFPVRITLVAWQWGRMNTPKLQSATPVEQSFTLE